jgi:hypothetical protein
MRPQKITFREMGVRGVLVYCADCRCSQSVALSADIWPDGVRLSDIEPRFVCSACGKRGADVRPNFRSSAPATMGYRNTNDQGLGPALLVPNPVTAIAFECPNECLPVWDMHDAD